MLGIIGELRNEPYSVDTLKSRLIEIKQTRDAENEQLWQAFDEASVNLENAQRRFAAVLAKLEGLEEGADVPAALQQEFDDALQEVNKATEALNAALAALPFIPDDKKRDEALDKAQSSLDILDELMCRLQETMKKGKLTVMQDQTDL